MTIAKRHASMLSVVVCLQLNCEEKDVVGLGLGRAAGCEKSSPLEKLPSNEKPHSTT